MVSFSMLKPQDSGQLLDGISLTHSRRLCVREAFDQITALYKNGDGMTVSVFFIRVHLSL